MYNTVGSASIGVRLDYLDKIITDEAREEQSIGVTQFIKVKSLEYDPDQKFIVFECEVFEHLIN